MTQHTMNLVLGFIVGWCTRGVYTVVKTFIVRKLRSKRLEKESQEYIDWLENTEEGRQEKKEMMGDLE